MSEIMRYARSLADAFADERAYAIFGPTGKPIALSLKRRSLWKRLWEFINGRR